MAQHWALLPFVVGIVVGLSVSTILLVRPSTEYVVTNVYIGAGQAGVGGGKDKELTDRLQRFEELMRELHPVEQVRAGPMLLAEEVTMKNPVHYAVILSEKEKLGTGGSVEVLRHTWAGDVPEEAITYYISSPTSHHDKAEDNMNGNGENFLKLSSEEPNELQVLRHICDQRINSSKWFYIGYDTTYVKTQELQLFLLSLEASQDWLAYMGRPVQKEFQDSRVCLPGPGSVLSYMTLSKLCHRLDGCSEIESATTDCVLGQCVRKLLPNIECNKQGHPQQLFLWYDSGKSKGPIIDPKNQAVLSRALTVYPVADPKLMYNIHQLVVGRRLNESQHLARELKQAVEQMRAFLPQTETSYAQSMNQDISSREDIWSWQLITNSRLMEIGSANPARKIPGYWKREIEALASQAIEYLSTTQDDKQLVFSKIVNAYWRLYPQSGMEYIVDFEAKPLQLADSETPPPPIRFCVTLVRPYSPIEISPIQPQVKDSKRLTLVLVMSGEEVELLEAFMKMLGAVLDESQIGINLLVVKMRSEEEKGAKKTDSLVETILHSYERQYLRASFSVVTSPYILSRSHGLALALHEVKPTDILFLADLHLHFNESFLERCRALPLQGQQVYYPIAFTRSASSNTSTQISADVGHWLVKSVGVGCIYAADVLTSVQTEGGKGIPKEVDTAELYRSLLEKGYEMIRGVDDGLTKDAGKDGSCELDLVGDVYQPCKLDQDYSYEELRLRTRLSELLFDHEGKHSETKF